MYSEDRKKRKKSSQNEENATRFFSKFFRKRTKRLLTDIDRLFTKIMWYQILASFVLICIGVLFLFWPSISVEVLGVLFGLNILGFGAIHFYAYRKRGEIPLFRYHFIYGIVAVLLGILTLLNPFTFMQVVTIFIGLWILYMAFVKGEFALRLRKMKESSWLLLLVSSVLEVFMSVLIFINPFSNLVITSLAGAYFVLCGIINCTDAVLTKNRSIDFLENL